MKKIGILFVSMLVLLIGIASADSLPTVVHGNIYEQDGMTPVEGAEVTVTCPVGGDEQVLTDTTDNHGYYLVEFMEGCVVGDTVEVCVYDICQSEQVESNYTLKNIVIINIPVPEFSALAAGIALVGASAGFIFLRRKK